MPIVKVKNEELFRYFAHSDCEPNDIGRRQFYDEQSLGTKPDSPDPYYETLILGKKRFDWQVKEHRNLYLSTEWWGWIQMWKDWEGKRWILPYLFKWHHNLPEWFDKEITREQLLDEYGV